MVKMPEELRGRLESAGQEHVLKWFSELSESGRADLLRQLEALDLDQLRELYGQRDQQTVVPSDNQIAPVPLAPLDSDDAALRALGVDALRRGEVAVLVVAGGQGTRLGFDHPKGMFPIGPVSGKSLFQIHAEKVLATQRRYGGPLPFLVMTSPATHAETVRFFEEHQHFGIKSSDIFFFRQGTMPALDLANGKLLREEPSQLCLSPNGHGGTVLALAESGLLDTLQQRGFRHLSYFQVDNPFVLVADPAFLGHHVRARAEVSTKAIAKNGPLDKLGNLVLIDGRCSIIEYSDLPERLARQTDAAGQLRLRIGSPAIHIFDLDFLRRVTTGAQRIPFHVARKKVPFLNDHGDQVQQGTENALKFEMFIFDVLPRAERWTVVETDRRIEFHPLKNATGADSPATVKQALSNQAGDWLEQCGVRVPRQPGGDVAVPLEISPLFALDAEELRGKVGPQTSIAQATYFG
jgi:UDP-N-acetylglucosamine/UDP-N-acetylgalactosamine diphosphorylase